jgi:hypothetical protein
MGRISFESEYIKVVYDDDIPEIELDREFFYLNLGYHVTEPLFAYAGYWYGIADVPYIVAEIPEPVITIGEDIDKIPTMGMTYSLNERIIFKGQYSPVDLKREVPLLFSETLIYKDRVHYIAAAVSVFF